MRITVDIPENDLEDAIRFTCAKAADEAIVSAVADFNRRNRMADLAKHAGTCSALVTAKELQAQRRQR